MADKNYDKNHPVWVPDDWVYSSGEECYINWKTGDKFSIKDFVFVDGTADPNQCGTNLKTGDKFCVEEELHFIDEAAEKFRKQISAITGYNFDTKGDQSTSVAGAAKQIVPKQFSAKVVTGCNFGAKGDQSTSVAATGKKIAPKQFSAKVVTRYNFVAKGDQSTSVASVAKKIVPKQELSDEKILPLRLYSRDGQRIHRQMSIEYNLANKRCEGCGKVGNLTCFSNAFRKWALRKVTEKEVNQKCSRCGELGHICLDCHIPIHYNWDWPHRAEYSGAKRRKIGQCSHCGEAGHNRRTCGRRN